MSVGAARTRPLPGWRRVPRRWLMGLVSAYRLLLSPWLGSACRFEPTCSRYALEALERHGARRGGWLTLCRLARCHPACAGGHDPVPTEPAAGLFTRLMERSDRTAVSASVSESTSQGSKS